MKLAIMTEDRTHPDPVKDKLCYKRGDVVMHAEEFNGRLESAEVWHNEVRVPQSHGLWLRLQAAEAILGGDDSARYRPEAATIRDLPAIEISLVRDKWLAEVNAWVKAEHTRDNFPGVFAIVDIDGLPLQDAEEYASEGITYKAVTDETGGTKQVMDDRAINVRRKHRCKYMQMERRSPGTYEQGHPKEGQRRDSLRAYKWIKRAWVDADVQSAFEVKR